MHYDYPESGERLEELISRSRELLSDVERLEQPLELDPAPIPIGSQLSHRRHIDSLYRGNGYPI